MIFHLNLQLKPEQMCSQEAKVTENRESTSGLTLQLNTTYIQCYGTCTRLCILKSELNLCKAKTSPGCNSPKQRIPVSLTSASIFPSCKKIKNYRDSKLACSKLRHVNPAEIHRKGMKFGMSGKKKTDIIYMQFKTIKGISLCNII